MAIPLDHSPRRARGRLRKALQRWTVRFAPTEKPEGGEGPLRYVVGFLVVFAVGMVVISLFGDQGLIAYHRLNGEATRLRSEVAELKVRKARLVEEIRALREEPAYIELLARQRLGLVRPGDIVLQLPRVEGSR